jgi:hypothetical protein
MALLNPSRITAAIVAASLFVFAGCSRAGNAEAPKTPAAGGSTTQPAKTPAPAPSTVLTPAAKPGKTPGKPAPTLTADTLAKATELVAAAKVLSNEGVKLRNEGKNEESRAKQSAASDKLEELKTLTKTQWAWQEEAELGDWALTGEYVALGNLYTEVGKLENQIRKGGGTR